MNAEARHRLLHATCKRPLSLSSHFNAYFLFALQGTSYNQKASFLYLPCTIHCVHKNTRTSLRECITRVLYRCSVCDSVGLYDMLVTSWFGTVTNNNSEWEG